MMRIKLPVLLDEASLHYTWYLHITGHCVKCKQVPVVFDEAWEVCVEKPVQESVARHRVENQQQVC